MQKNVNLCVDLKTVMQNGKYQIHMKTINASQVTDRNQLAFNVYSELLTAFSIID